MSNLHSDELFQRALADHQAGRLPAAKAAYQQVLAGQPSHADALHMLGVLSGQEGRPDLAVQLIQRALQARPHYPEALVNLGMTFTALGQLPAAIDAYQRAAAIAPDDATLHARLADALSRQGRFEEARASFERALQLKPDWVPPMVGLGIVLGQLDRFDEAQRVLDRAIQLAPNDPLAHEAKGLVFLRKPTRMADATQSLQRAVELAPNLATAWNALGGALRAMGNFEQAADCFRRAVELRPDIAVFAKNLSTVGTLAADAAEAEVSRLRALLNRPGAPTADRITAGFALGKLLDTTDQFDQAFEHFAAANALVKQDFAARGEHFDADLFGRQIDQIVATFTPDFFERHQGWGDPSALPVFIVGMPRSGTTLVEQIVASHPAVVGAGELRDIDRISAALGRSPADWNRQAVAQAASAHIERLLQIARDEIQGRRGNPKLAGDTIQRVVDKMMGNIVELGLIATLFPAARVILCRRDPRDNCLSCFFQHFATGNLFTYDLADCAHRYLHLERLTTHWQRALPLAMLSVQYEDVVADLPGESRKLIDFLGLPWHPACLEFHRTQRAVITAAGWQVRRPIYRDAVGRWRHYERHLTPLMSALGV